MHILAELAAARRSGVIHAHFTPRDGRALEELLAEFELSPNVSALNPVDLQLAERIAALVLAQDLAYGIQLMPLTDAARLAAAFVELFAGSKADCFTNASFNEEGGRLSLSEWTPLTDATFDTGILVLSTERAGCLWVQDED
ncbi:MAG TPA: hypothetical protein VJV78_01620 [Polyangiales bacterium]|nr:hypothetical protein [Polyangiales bacterium]